MKILVVDDSRTMRVIIMRVLAQLGIKNVIEAGDGQAALEIFKNNHFDAVLSDWNMPIMNGLDFLKEVRQINKTIPFLMITTEAERGNVVSAIQAGVTDYVIKPFTQDALRKKLEQRIASLV
ncbi:response regulator [Rubinisphaera sp.]|uniref:response regulator n=1 Tax=Rubinisphaera sp. TaxID=2024857 RepID=UPI000C1157D3|nr:response regulator [Rubinisphaera sp.]MBV09856.1 two-component system response regulator [Rubinisphaera sp.]HCS50918.1 two-component system response regulator [Planctomycetaceae bacterium]|tara:strand:+ start:1864 stop:2229 length:366 start_codon:yes stop_codon:yes gene_type:complete